MKHKFTLRDVLELYGGEGYPLPDTWAGNDFKEIRPDGGDAVKLCFMCESETHIAAYASHPILIPWYECPVSSIDVKDEALQIWLDYEQWLPEKVVEWRHQ